MPKIDFEDQIAMLIKEDNVLSDLREYALNNNVPIIRPITQNILEMIISLSKPVKVLEIGTAIGFSALVMYNAIKKYAEPDILTIEKDENRYNIAVNNFLKYGASINSVLGDAYENMLVLDEQYDFIFLDGPKGQYMKYLPILIKLMKKDSVLFVDNLYQDDMITKSRYQILRRDRTIHSRMKEFIEEIISEEGLQTSIISMADGIAVVRRI